jgi:8-oxo-dGTP diphosphatase
MGAKEQGASGEGRWVVIPRTLSFITHGDHILLMKRGTHKRIFPGHYNGLGGHIERDEDPYQSAIREIQEESGLDVVNVRYRGTTHIDAGNEMGIILFIFTAEATQLEVIGNEEGTLEWLHLPTLLAEIEQGNGTRLLVEDLPILLPMLFGDIVRETPIFAHVSYDVADVIQFRLSRER